MGGRLAFLQIPGAAVTAKVSAVSFSHFNSADEGFDDLLYLRSDIGPLFRADQLRYSGRRIA
jgi:hypothetical protein